MTKKQWEELIGKAFRDVEGVESITEEQLVESIAQGVRNEVRKGPPVPGSEHGVGLTKQIESIVAKEVSGMSPKLIRGLRADSIKQVSSAVAENVKDIMSSEPWWDDE